MCAVAVLLKDELARVLSPDVQQAANAILRKTYLSQVFLLTQCINFRYSL